MVSPLANRKPNNTNNPTIDIDAKDKTYCSLLVPFLTKFHFMERYLSKLALGQLIELKFVDTCFSSSNSAVPYIPPFKSDSKDIAVLNNRDSV